MDKELLTIFLSESRSVLDIGGGLRIRKGGDRYEKQNEWILPLLGKIEYKILDVVPDHHPDIVGDIHHLPFADESIESIACCAVLEHVTDPFLALKEMLRVLKKGGLLYMYVPFLFYHHSQGRYGDYWRFTDDGVKELLKDFFEVRIKPTRGDFETWFFLSPLRRVLRRLPIARLFVSKKNSIGEKIARQFDSHPSRNSSGFVALARKK